MKIVDNIDSNEPLVDIKKYCHGITIALDKKRLMVEKTAFVRLTVAKMIGEARKKLPRGYNFIIRDAWRPAYIQASIFYDFLKNARKRFPYAKENELVKEVKKYVAPWKGIGASGHMTGGAIDIRVINKNGRRLPVVSKKMSYQENALPRPDKLPAYLQRNRKILSDALNAVGFSTNTNFNCRFCWKKP